jgi:NAD(P)H-dependent FMN reductase
MKIKVIEASIRPNRVGERITKWVMTTAEKQPDFELELLDLAEYDLPHFDETVSPRFNPKRDPHPTVKRWLDKLGEADGFIIVTPEYNHAIPGALKNAIDYTDFQLAKKPVAIVSYGTVGGARAAEMLKPILIEAKAAVVPEAVTVISPNTTFDESGRYLGDPEAYGPPIALATTLTELGWWAKTLAVGRKELSQA